MSSVSLFGLSLIWPNMNKDERKYWLFMTEYGKAKLQLKYSITSKRGPLKEEIFKNDLIGDIRRQLFIYS